MLGRWFNNNLNAFSGPFPICCIANVEQVFSFFSSKLFFKIYLPWSKSPPYLLDFWCVESIRWPALTNGFVVSVLSPNNMCLSHVEYQHFLQKGLFAAFSSRMMGFRPLNSALDIFLLHTAQYNFYWVLLKMSGSLSLLSTRGSCVMYRDKSKVIHCA